ncbi:MAG TPA: hypothetical protein VE988_29530 [Gemmataceae bacterium]|nr:hypothetical protein [Gemmataceae bacterium]
MSNLKLGSDELRIIGHAINWQLNVPYEHTSPPQLCEEDAAFLSDLLTDLSRLNRMCLSNGVSVSVETGDPYSCKGGMVLLPSKKLRLMTDAVASFLGELQSTPAELEIVTGLPTSKTAELLSQLEAMSQTSLSSI